MTETSTCPAAGSTTRWMRRRFIAAVGENLAGMGKIWVQN
eukprot:COSAG06_NODE_24168_length_670_cov_1.747811_1_plen_39_part_01